MHHDDQPRYELMSLLPDSTYDEVAAVLGMPQPPFGYHVERDVQTPTRDGHRLSGDHYVPHTDQPKGTLLVRTPYGLTFPFTYLWSGIFAAHGYHVLFQSCRGTAGSSDRFQPMVREAHDAQDTVAWLREQSWFDGNLITGGASYHAFTQYALLQDPPPELRASLIAMGPHDFGRVVFDRGAFQLETWLGWSVRMAELERAIAAGGVEDAVARAELDAGALPLGDAADGPMHGDAPWYREWLRHTDLSDEFWAPYRATDALDRITTPVLLIGGWDDVFLDQTVETFTALRGRGVETALTIGPWQHLDLVGRAAPTLIQESIAWLDHHLHGAPSERSPLRLFVRGAEQWREHPDWPTAQSSWAITGTGRLGRGGADTDTTTFTYDPREATPALGGRRNSTQAGELDNALLENRHDVVVFTSEPFGESLDIIGVPHVDVSVSVDNPYADLFVRLCDVDENGLSTNFADGIRRLDPDVTPWRRQTVSLDLDPCARRIRAGHRLRLQIAGGAHPRFARNLGSGEPPEHGTTMRATRHTIHHDATALTLPVEGGPPLSSPRRASS